MANIQKSYEQWDCNDPRFPQDKYLIGPLPDQSMLDTIQEIQLQPVGMVKKGKEFHFKWGRRRLKAIRQLQAEGKHSGLIDVVILTGIDPDDHGRLALIENSVRSPNEVDAYTSVKELLKQPDATYKTVAQAVGLTIGEVKAIERKWHKVPTWSVNAVQRGEIAPSTAIEIGKQSPELQAKHKETLQREKKLSLSDVKAEKRFVQTQVYAGMQDALGINVVQPRQVFLREELLEVHDLIAQNKIEEAYQLASNLLSQTE